MSTHKAGKCQIWVYITLCTRERKIVSLLLLNLASLLLPVGGGTNRQLEGLNKTGEVL